MDAAIFQPPLSHLLKRSLHLLKTPSVCLFYAVYGCCAALCLGDNAYIWALNTQEHENKSLEVPPCSRWGSRRQERVEKSECTG